MMGRACTVCTHAQRAKIDAALVANEPNRRIAAQYGVTEQALRRHKANHLPAEMAQAQAAADVARADNLLEKAENLRKVAQTLLVKAANAGDYRTALSGIGQARACLELQAKLLGELDTSPQVNVLVNPQWLELRAVIVQALAPWPQARQAVAKALAEVDNGHSA